MQQQLKIEGMTCQHCQRAVEQALRQVPGVESATVDLATGTASVSGSATLEALCQAVQEEGYAASSCAPGSTSAQ